MELEALRERVSELERRERKFQADPGEFWRENGTIFAQMSHMHEAIFVIFDKKVGVRQ